MKVHAIAIGTSFISLSNCVCVYYIRKYHAGQMKVRAITIGTLFISIFNCVCVLN